MSSPLHLVVGIAISTVVANSVLMGVLLYLAADRISGYEDSTNIHRHEDRVKTFVDKELGRLKNISQESDLPKIRSEIADMYSREGNLLKPALHLEITPEFDKSEDLPILTWRSGSNATYHGRLETYENRTVNVADGGYYYIYCVIRYSGSGTEALDYGRILHTVIMKKKGEENESPTVLMQNFKSTPVIRRGRLVYTTSSLGGTFYLPAFSKVMVTSSVPKNIDTSPHGSYFGLFLM